MKRAAMGGRYSLDSSGGDSTRENSSYSNARGDDSGELANGCRRGSMKVSLIFTSSATYLNSSGEPMLCIRYVECTFLRWRGSRTTPPGESAHELPDLIQDRLQQSRSKMWRRGYACSCLTFVSTAFPIANTDQWKCYPRYLS
jgi:hypothetical protein